jgi:hypothetical protein
MAKQPTTDNPKLEGASALSIPDNTTGLAIPDDIDIFGDANFGNENVGSDDVTIPRLAIIQALSPELKKTKAEYIEGASEGDVFIRATGELLEQPIRVVNVYYQVRYIEWVPREKGGGLVNPDHDASILDDCERNDDGDYVLPNGNEVVKTPEHFVIVVYPDGSWDNCVMSMSGSKAKVSRNWNTVLRRVRIRNPATGAMVHPARFYSSFELSTVPESSDRGDYMNWKVSPSVPTVAIPEVGPEVYRAAREFHELIQSGKVKAEVEEKAPSGGNDVGGEDDDNVL